MKNSPRQPFATCVIIFVWAAVLLSFFIAVYRYNNKSIGPDPRCETISDRSFILFVDGADTVHYRPFCSDAHYAGEPYKAVFYSLDNLDEDVTAFGVCPSCCLVYEDNENWCFHSDLSCPNIPKRAKIYESLITDLLTERYPNPCPYCY